ncbi:MAG: ABC transporter ATP-binding protein [Thermoanaerobaculales bacterium]|jgi:ABC-2 type transport system ATP-binding protein|nr:ABC transporter ATP-binding protein [Thermoanaerobaculales bacterium]
MNTTAEPIVVDQLTVRYGRTTAVDKVSFSVAAGQVYALLGRNGAGKSSTIGCLVGHRKAAAGECRIFGLDTWKARRHVMARVGLVPETPDIPPRASARELGRFLGRIRPVWNAEDYENRLERVGVPRRLPSGSLSKGQRRQLALAAALASEPEVLILDDPTLGLDAVVRRTLLEELVGELADRGTTVLVTTHDLTGIEGIADRVGIMQHGRLVYDEPMEGLKERFRRLRCVLDNGQIEADVRHAIEPLDPVAVRVVGARVDAVLGQTDRESIKRFREITGITEVELEPLGLEEIFVALCGDDYGGGKQ